MHEIAEFTLSAAKWRPVWFLMEEGAREKDMVSTVGSANDSVRY